MAAFARLPFFLDYIRNMPIISNTQLNDTLQNAIANVPPFYLDSHLFFTVLYATGCRPVEVFEISRWTNYSPTQVRLLPAKGQGYRYIDKSILPSLFYEMIIGSYRQFWLASVRQFRYSFENVYSITTAQMGDKSSKLYLFRYNKFRQLTDGGMSEEDIKEYFSETSLLITHAYINNPIYY